MSLTITRQSLNSYSPTFYGVPLISSECYIEPVSITVLQRTGIKERMRARP
jgi:hypothetical protein